MGHFSSSCNLGASLACEILSIVAENTHRILPQHDLNLNLNLNEYVAGSKNGINDLSLTHKTEVKGCCVKERKKTQCTEPQLCNHQADSPLYMRPDPVICKHRKAPQGMSLLRLDVILNSLMNDIIQIYSGITCGRVLSGEPLYT